MNSSQIPDYQRMRHGDHEPLHVADQGCLGVHPEGIVDIAKKCRRGETQEEEGDQHVKEAQMKEENVAWLLNLNKQKVVKNTGIHQAGLATEHQGEKA